MEAIEPFLKEKYEEKVQHRTGLRDTDITATFSVEIALKAIPMGSIAS